MLKQVVVNPPDLAGGGLKQAGRGQVVDLAGHAVGEVVDGRLHRVVEQFRVAAGLGELEVDVPAGLLAGQRPQLVADRDAIDQVGVLRPPQDRPERFLADQEQFQRRPHVQGGTDQQPQVGQGVAVQQMGFVEDQQQGALGPRGPFQDLFVNAFFAAAWRLAQLRDDQLQQARRGQVGEVAVEGLAVLRQQAVEEAFQEGGFADAAGAGDQPQLAALDQVFQPRQTFVHALVLPQGGDRSVFGKGLALQLEVFQIHQSFLSGSRDWS